MRQWWKCWSVAIVAVMPLLACTPFLGPLPDAGRDMSTENPPTTASDARIGQDVTTDKPPILDAGPTDVNGDEAGISADATGESAAAEDIANDSDASRSDADGSQGAGDTDSGSVLPGTGLLVHLEADYGLMNQSGMVTKWLDQSGNGFNATEPDPNYEPAFIEQANAGFGAALFGISPGQDLALPSGFANLGDGVSLFFIVLIQDTEGFSILIQTDPNGPTLTVVSGASSGTVDIDYHVGPGTTSAGHVYNFAYGAWHLIEVVQQAGVVGGTSNFSAFADATAVVSATQPVPTAEVKSAVMGLTIDDAVPALQAALIYSRPVTNDERRQIEQYLMAKWQISP